jgi:Fe-S-cluster containining protein
MSENAISEVRALYETLGTRPVERRCTGIAECCQFKLTGLTPYLTKGEAIVAARAWRASGRKQLPPRADGSCPMLGPGTLRCAIYKDRPFGCRTHFCAAAGGPYSRRDVLDLIRGLEAIDARLGGTGPRKIESAVADALAELH